MTFVLHSYAIYDEITGTAHDGHFPDPYKFQLSYKHITLKLFPFLHIYHIIHYWYIYQSRLSENK